MIKSLSNPEMRRALRSILRVITTLSLIVLLFCLVRQFNGDKEGLRLLATGALAIIGIGEFFHGAENVSRAVSIAFGPASASIGDEDNAK